MDGEGTLISAQGDKYKGQFRDGQKHGFGIEILSDGSRYEVRLSTANAMVRL